MRAAPSGEVVETQAVYRDVLPRVLDKMAREDHGWFIDLAAELEAAPLVTWNDKRRSRGVPGNLDFARNGLITRVVGIAPDIIKIRVTPEDPVCVEDEDASPEGLPSPERHGP
jgi:hypothetical protein